MKLPVSKVSFLMDSEDRPIYLVQFERLSVNINILMQQYGVVNHVIIQWDRFNRSKKRLTQCFRCQQYGHGASKCGFQFRCVKCLDTHEPGQCSRKSRDDEGSQNVSIAEETTLPTVVCVRTSSATKTKSRINATTARQPPTSQ